MSKQWRCQMDSFQFDWQLISWLQSHCWRSDEDDAGTKLLCVNMQSMRPSAKGVGLSPSVYISVTTYNHPECTPCSSTTSAALLGFIALLPAILYHAHWIEVYSRLKRKVKHNTNVGCCKVVKWRRRGVLVDTWSKCILCWNAKWKVCSKVAQWRRRGNGAYWIDGVVEAHRQMVPHQGNLTRAVIVTITFEKILLEMIIQMMTILNATQCSQADGSAPRKSHPLGIWSLFYHFWPSQLGWDWENAPSLPPRKFSKILFIRASPYGRSNLGK